MKTIRTILAACDLSPFTDQVLDYAHVCADSFGAKIILANVINRRDVEAIEYAVHKVLLVDAGASSDKAIHQFVKEREEKLQLLGRSLKAPHALLKTIVKTGAPHQELLEIVSTEKVDLVVMGTRGRSNIKEALLGGTAAKMFRLCPVPILSVRLHP